jgi:CheY-like chemotaxis protein
LIQTAAQTVLVVDDDPMLLDLLAYYIEGTGCQAVTITSGTEALQLARTILPALVLCNLTMPGLGGVEVFRKLRADPMTAELSLVLMSGDPSPNLQGVVIDAFLAKPFNMEEPARGSHLYAIESIWRRRPVLFLSAHTVLPPSAAWRARRHIF